ncbi:hypothetical protein GCM10010149_45880 [Nonomuraea roseoviolacea subsp. roseoviolacea]
MIVVSPPPIDAATLESRVRRRLSEAGFAVERRDADGDGGLRVWHEPGRGVVVSWEPDAAPGEEHAARYRLIRGAVRLALRTILAEAGYHVREDDGRMIVTPHDQP